MTTTWSAARELSLWFHYQNWIYDSPNLKSSNSKRKSQQKTKVPGNSPCVRRFPGVAWGLSRLRILQLSLLWLWLQLWVPSLAWELPYATDAAKEKKKKKKAFFHAVTTQGITLWWNLNLKMEKEVLPLEADENDFPSLCILCFRNGFEQFAFLKSVHLFKINFPLLIRLHICF